MPWTADEDRSLRLLHKWKGDAWSAVSDCILGRSRDEYRLRLLDVLGRTGLWTVNEDRLLEQAHDVLGCAWDNISKNVPGRAANKCRDRWVALQEALEQRRALVSSDEDHQLSQFHLKHGENKRKDWTLGEDCLLVGLHDRYRGV